MELEIMKGKKLPAETINKKKHIHNGWYEIVWQNEDKKKEEKQQMMLSGMSKCVK